MYSIYEIWREFWKRFPKQIKIGQRKRRKGNTYHGSHQKCGRKIYERSPETGKKAYALGEVPIGCVIVHEGKIIGRGYNRRNTDKNTLAHAEITAINKASKVIGDWRLEECTLYVTLEPCQMCAGAIVQARIPEVVMGCMNPKAGCAGSILNILEMPQFNHQVKVTRGILEAECSQMLKTFFEELRIRNKQEKEARKSLSSLS